MGTIVDTFKHLTHQEQQCLTFYITMGFGDLKADSGLKVLNEYLADKSYIEGFQPSAADTVVFGGISSAPKAQFVHALRWYNHIKSYGKATTGFPGVPKALTEYGPAGTGKAAKDDADDDFDLFGSDDDEDDEEQERVKEERLAAYAAKKQAKPGPIAKSSILLDVKPWDDETDMKKLEECVRSVQTDGMKWGASKLVPLAYGIEKLQILVVVEDDKVGTDYLEEEITAFVDYIQSVDVAAFNKI